MKEVKTYGQIVKGRVLYSRIEDFKKAVLNTFEEGERFHIFFRKIYKKRSSLQNAYYWGVIINAFLEGYEQKYGHPLADEFTDLETGELLQIPITAKERANRAHAFLKSKFSYVDLSDESNDSTIKGIKSTAENSTIEQEAFHDACRNYIFVYFGIRVLLPNEQARIDEDYYR